MAEVVFHSSSVDFAATGVLLDYTGCVHAIDGEGAPSQPLLDLFDLAPDGGSEATVASAAGDMLWVQHTMVERLRPDGWIASCPRLLSLEVAADSLELAFDDLPLATLLGRTCGGWTSKNSQLVSDIMIGPPALFELLFERPKKLGTNKRITAVLPGPRLRPSVLADRAAASLSAGGRGW